MSKKSTARTGSEGDADSTFTDVFANIRSGSSSCNSKRELEGGPFGDSPCEKNQNTYKDYFILMFQDDDTTEPSESSDGDQELYNLQNDYMEKLNILRRKLNLIEISDDCSSSSPNNCNNRCTITEIVEEVNSEKSYKIDKKSNECSESNRSTSKDNRSKTDKSDLITFFSSPTSYKFESFSTANIFEPDYNPPKKKVCCRQKTPRHTSISEGNLPYYTRVGLHDDLFSSSKKKEVDVDDVNELIETKATQYTENDFDLPEENRKEREVLKFKETDNVNLFPEVIVEYKTENVDSNSSTSLESKPVSNCSKITIGEQEDITALSLNIIEENSDDSFTTTTYSTTIDSPDTKTNVKRRFGRKNKVSSSDKLTMWEEIRRLHSSRGSDGDKAEKGCDTNEERIRIEVIDRNMKRKKPRCDYMKQYIAYRKQKSYVKPRYIPFGTKIVERCQKVKRSAEQLRRCESSSASNGDEKVDDEEEKKNAGGPRKFWEKICFCWSSQRE